MPSSPQPQLQEVIDWAKAAGKIALDGFLKDHDLGFKGATDVVTEIDYQCEKLLMDSILSAFPQHAILTEEAGAIGANASDRWYIDPLDGTVNYSHRIPMYAVSVAYESGGGLQLGVVYDPSRDECFAAERGKGAWLNGQPIHVSNCAALEKSLLCTGFPYRSMDKFNRNLKIFDHLTRHSQGVRRFGCAALEVCYVADGRLDGYWEQEINAWDIAAGTLIVQEAGGVVTDLEGNPDFFKPPYAVLGSAPGIHALLLEQIRRF